VKPLAADRAAAGLTAIAARPQKRPHGHTDDAPLRCPFCGEDRLIEVIGSVLVCAVCAHQTRLETPVSAREVGPGRAIGARRDPEGDPR
jgi:hypothetical protein